MTSSDSDSDMTKGGPKGMKGHTVISSSEEEAASSSKERTRSRRPTRQTRHSECIQRRQSKPSRRITRDEQWNAIPSEDVSSAYLSHLKPRKLVNDFTRVTHRYNYDPAETSGEESLEDFVNDSSTTSDSNGSSKLQQKGHRVKGYRSRIVNAETETSDEEDAAVEHAQAMDLNTSTFMSPEQVDKVDYGQEDCYWSTDESDSHSVFSPRISTRKQSVLDSDSDSENSVHKPLSGLATSKQSKPSKIEVGCQAHTLPNTTDSEESSSDTCTGRIQKLAKERRKRKNTVFSKLREAREKRLKLH